MCDLLKKKGESEAVKASVVSMGKHEEGDGESGATGAALAASSSFLPFLTRQHTRKGGKQTNSGLFGCFDR